MRLNELSVEQQKTFMVLARELVAADGRLALDEVERLDLLYREMQLSATDAGEPAAAVDLNYFFPDDKSRALVVLNLLLLAHGDGAIHEREREVALRVAADLRVAAADISRMEAWAGRHAALMSEMRAFWIREPGTTTGSQPESA
jgi:hypothetical protein